MQLIEISNGAVSARISTLGAELQSLQRNGTEYLWQGNPAYWAGQSPLLFPNTGRFWENKFRHNNQEYTLDIHGFARTTEFTPVEVKPSRCVLAMKSNEETEKNYPFKFFLIVTYQVTENGIEVSWMVRNQGESDMHFQIGAHPAFNLPAYDPDEEVHGYFSFKTTGLLEYLIPLEKGCVDPSQPHPLELDDRGMLPITAKTFDIDTYVIDSTNVSSCTLLTPNRIPWLTVHFDMPILALWAPTIKHPDCPFVCIEPWCGSCDTIGYSGTIADRRIMNHLAPADHFINTYRITLDA